MPRKPSDLARVRRATTRRRAAELEYRAALQRARDSGHSLAEIAAEAGVSRNAIAKMTTSRATPAT